MNKDGRIDLRISAVNSDDYSKVYYYNEQWKKLSKASLVPKNGYTAIRIDKLYGEKAEGRITTSGWRDCFEDAAGSTVGVVGGVASSFFGPAGAAGFYGGLALGCLIFD